MVTFETLKKEIKKLEEDLQSKKTELLKLQAAALPFVIGDTVKATSGWRFKGEHLKVVAIHSVAYGWPRVVRRKANGEWGVREFTLYGGFEVTEPTTDGR